MQLLQSLNRDPKTLSKEISAGYHLPYLRHVDDHTIETRDGLLMQFISIRGLLFETADTNEINYRKTLRDAMLKALGSSNFAFYHHVVRRQIDVSFESEYPDDFSARLNEKWVNRLKAKKLYVNDLIITLVRRPLSGKIGIATKIKNLFFNAEIDRNVASKRELRELNMARDALIAQLGNYEPRLLSVYKSEQGMCSEPLEFLSSIYNGELRPVLLPYQDLGEYLPYRRISFGQETIELGRAGNTPKTFIGIVSIKDYPAQTAPGMFDELLRLPIELIMSQSFSFVDRGAALSQMNLAVRRMRSTEDEAISLRDELSQAKDDVAAGRAGFGEHHMTIAVKANTLEELNLSIAEVQAVLSDLGAISVREEIALEPAYWAQFPGNFKYIARRGLVSTSNFAGLASYHNFALGKPFDNHWGDAISLLETTAAGPYYFNFHNGDLGNFTIIGPSGSGKTVVLNFLLSQARKTKPNIIFFDKDRGAELFILAIGGKYDRLNPNFGSGLNPLQLSDTPSNRQFLINWIVQLTNSHNQSTDIDSIKAAIDANFEAPLQHRRLRHFAELFRGSDRPHSNDLWSRLKPWFGDGERAWLFDNENDIISVDSDVFGFDMTEILDDPIARTPAMMVLFHRIEERLNGDPTIIVIDEGWKALDDDVFVKIIKNWEKTIRKRNGIVGFATQSAQDALESKIASAVIEQAATQIFMINPKAREIDYINGFGLTHHEYEIIKNLPDNSHCFLIKNGNDSVVVRLNLNGEQELLTVLSGRETSIRILDEIREENKGLPENWLQLLLERI